MALDDTVAGTASNTYVLVADADSYYDKRTGPVADAWASALAQDKENALEVSAEMMNCLRYHGEKYSEDQALAFPRDYHLDSSEDPVIVECVKKAQIIQAGSIVFGATVAGEGESTDTIEGLLALGVKSVKVGTTNLSFGSETGSRDPRRAQLIDNGFSPEAASIIYSLMASTGKITHDAEDRIRRDEIRRIDPSEIEVGKVIIP